MRPVSILPKSLSDITNPAIPQIVCNLLLWGVSVYTDYMIDFDVVLYAARVANRCGHTGMELLADTGYDPTTECWEWSGARFRYGYGNAHVTTFDGVHRNMGAHRLAYMAVNGEPDLPYITHGCDNPSCCRPSHLKPDTQRGNLAGMHERGRSGGAAMGHPGETNHAARLDEVAVRVIRDAPWRYGLLTDFARQYGVTAQSIGNVRRRKTWTHLD